jgi:hypothetical protein
MTDGVRPQRRRRRCVYCGEPAGSLEHAWPEWLQIYMNPNRQRHIAQMPDGKIVDHPAGTSLRTATYAKDATPGWPTTTKDPAPLSSGNSIPNTPRYDWGKKTNGS